GGLPGVTDETTRPISPPVFIDEHMLQGVREAKQIENLTYQQSDIFHGERIPLKTVPPHMAGDDEETMAGAKFSTLGIDKKPNFFAPLNNELEEQMKREQDEEALYAQSVFMRRRSLATLKCVDTTKSTNRKITPPPNMERSTEVALNNMKLGESKEVDVEMVEIGYENPSEAGGGLQRHIATGSVDPWDGKVRKELHKIVALNVQGGFAKVYKSVNEGGKLFNSYQTDHVTKRGDSENGVYSESLQIVTPPLEMITFDKHLFLHNRSMGSMLRWGSGCDGHCDCSNGASCDRLTGFCDCRAGYMGKKCEIACPDGLWRANCIHQRAYACITAVVIRKLANAHVQPVGRDQHTK
ncbi:EGF-like domain protein, partial [Dictyocaulus viviparus]